MKAAIGSYQKGVCVTDWLINKLSHPTAWLMRRVSGQGTIQMLFILFLIVILLLGVSGQRVNTTMSEVAIGPAS